MKNTALDIAYKMIQLSEELSTLLDQKQNAKTAKEDAALNTRIGAVEAQFIALRDILANTIV